MAKLDASPHDARAVNRSPVVAAPFEPLASSRLALTLGLALALVVVGLSAWMRVHAALGDPNFDASAPEGMLRSDPALLYHFVERILAAGGGVPAEFHADRRILHPDVVDVTATFPLGLEFIVAWARELSGSTEPLHVFCVRVASVLASLAALGVYGLALELTRRVGWALVALVVWATTWANYRTIGFVLVGEDLSVPLFALHLYLVVRAARVRTTSAMILAAAAWIAALSTWHATNFFAAIEAVLVFAWFVRTRENPFAAGRAWSFAACALLLAFAVPFLRGTRFAGSLPMALVLGLAAAGIVGARRPIGRATGLGIALATAAGLLALSLGASWILGGGQAEYSHVWRLFAAKLAHLGTLPADPLELPGEVRLMWQGPFSTSSPEQLAGELGWALLALPIALAEAVLAFARGRTEDPRRVLVGAGLGVGVVCAWLISRTVILPGLLLPVAFAVAAERAWSRSSSMGRKQLLAAGLALVSITQSWSAFGRASSFRSSWYDPPQRRDDLRALVQALPRLVPEGEPIASDFVNSTAILAHTGHAIVLQPKYEDRASRDRAVEFFTTLYQGSPEDLALLLRDRYRCRYLVLDRFTLGLEASKYLGGLQRGAPPRAGSAWEQLAHASTPVLTTVPGFHLLYRSPPSIHDARGDAWDGMRVYEVDPGVVR